MDCSSIDEATLELALRERRGRDALAAKIAPVVRARVAQTLRKFFTCRTSEVEDICQEVLLTLFAHDARTLRGWSAERGLSLSGYVQLVARRVTLTRLKGTWSRRVHQPLESCEERAADSVLHPDRRLATRREVQAVVDRLRSEVSARGLELFEALFVEQYPLARVCEDFRLQPDAVYAWRSRLNRRARAIFAELAAAQK